ncbi:unnamed protein product [Rotaria sordida]|uniref:EF-hand domain-containing protein n=1 Tax=Rotaria sordida TaxID=392033 RepID=A0A814S0X0_9BILA|nr:unnamed protein product [Rotaria sordida]CAF1357918.1 unnamed protein product [Rotaria sordida]CAF1359536.1 unnamed protein product [Rotaria sordida]CAF1372466.1 unnamed protein product [Rotaria sordida]CAF3800309.1 unnamed protein product [Rotaria sordida]
MDAGNETGTLFIHNDTNQDGNINRTEYESTTSRCNRYNYGGHYYDGSERTTDRYASYGTTATGCEWTNDTAIHTNSLEETNAYLRRSTSDLFIDSSPQMIRRTTSESPITLEQRITVRYLQPPPVPEPGPLIIKEVRPRQPSPPPPLVIREHTPRPCTPPPLTLRERPPTPPPVIHSETIVQELSAVPVPPRSVIIERFPPHPERPRDIIIERWIPYGPTPERRTIVESAPAPIEYPRPFHNIIVYEGVRTRIIRRFENLGVTQENPDAYVARYGSTLLSPAALLQEARHFGVTEDISPPMPTSSMYTIARGNNFDCNWSDGVIRRTFTSSGVFTDIRRGRPIYRTGFRRYF